MPGHFRCDSRRSRELPVEGEAAALGKAERRGLVLGYRSQEVYQWVNWLFGCLVLK